MPNSIAISRFLAPALALLLGACVDGGSSLAPDSATRSSSTGATLVECPTEATASATGTIDLLGGSISVTDVAGGTHEVVFPLNAVSVPTVFTLTAPAGQYVKVDVTASDPLTGEQKSVEFAPDARPTLAVSYKRCTRSNILSRELRLYHTHSSTNAVLEGPFGGKEGQASDPRVSAAVPHFSAYAVGTP